MKATVIALGTFLALIVTGASAQAIGRKGLFYLKQGEMMPLLFLVVIPPQLLTQIL